MSALPVDGSPHILVKPLFFNTPSGYTHIEFATVK
jgi:hypothetical protein